MLPMRSLSATVTYQGRTAIQTAKESIEKGWPGSNIVYGDTDSLFINFDAIAQAPRTLGELANLAEHIASEVTEKQFRKPMCLEFEKIYTFFKQYGKKRYLGLKYEPDGIKSKQLKKITLAYPKTDAKGVILEKRDSIPIAKDLYRKINDLHIHHGAEGLDESIRYLDAEIKKIVAAGEDGNVLDHSLFTINKRIAASYSDPYGVAHSVVAEKMRSRGMVVNPNDHIKYVILEQVDFDTLPKPMQDVVERKNMLKTNLSVSLRSEEFAYAKEHNLRIDRHHYVELLKTDMLSAFELDGIPEHIQARAQQIFSDALSDTKVARTPAQVKALRLEKAAVKYGGANAWVDNEMFGEGAALSNRLRECVIRELSSFQSYHSDVLGKHYGDNFQLEVDMDFKHCKDVFLGNPLLRLPTPSMDYCLPHGHVHNRTSTKGSVPFEIRISLTGGVKFQCMKAGDGKAWPEYDETRSVRLIDAELIELLQKAKVLLNDDERAAFQRHQQDEDVKETKREESKKRKAAKEAAPTNNKKITDMFKKRNVIDMGV